MRKSLLLSGLLLLFLGLSCAHAVQEDPVPLWADGAPGAVGQGLDHEPTITPYLPENKSLARTAVVVCPGGGYGHLAMDHEGDQVGKWLNSNGIAAFLLRYRHAPDYQHPIPLGDARRAIQYVRSNAKRWGVNPKAIGILGFSAGGHLCASASTLFVEGDAKAQDPVAQVSSRPDFSVLVYPVISLTAPYTHVGSRNNLLGKDSDAETHKQFSAENNVTKKTPPTFLIASSGDTGVPAENSVCYYLALRRAGVPAEMHIYEKGKHGFGLAPKDPVLSTWPGLCITWIQGLEL